MGPQQRDGSKHVFPLSERGVHRINVLPFRIGGIEFCFQLARWSHANDFVWEIDARAFVEIELLSHLLDTFEFHLQAETIEVTVAGLHNRKMQVGRAVIPTHATGELVADGYAAAANQVLMVDCDRALL